MTLQHKMKIKGTEELYKKWRAADSRLAGPARRFFDRATRTVRAKAIDYTPVDLGRLHSSYFVAIGAQKVPDEATIFNPVTYAGPLEHKKGAKPRGVGRIPFFGPAIRDSAQAVSGFSRRLLREFTEAMGR